MKYIENKKNLIYENIENKSNVSIWKRREK